MNGCLGPKLHTHLFKRIYLFIYNWQIFHCNSLSFDTCTVHTYASCTQSFVLSHRQKGFAYALCTLAPLIIKSSHLSPFYFCVTESRLIFETFCCFFASFSVLPFCWLSLFSANIRRVCITLFPFSISMFHCLCQNRLPNAIKCDLSATTQQISSSANS